MADYQMSCAKVSVNLGLVVRIIFLSSFAKSFRRLELVIYDTESEY